MYTESTVLQERLEQGLESLPSSLAELQQKATQLEEDEGFQRLNATTWKWVDEDMTTLHVFINPPGASEQTALITIYEPESVFADDRMFTDSPALEDIPQDLTGYIADHDDEAVRVATAAFWTIDAGQTWEYSQSYFDLIAEQQEDGGAYNLINLLI